MGGFRFVDWANSARRLLKFMGNQERVPFMKDAQPILFIIPDLNTGGAEKHLALVLPRLKQRGYKPLVFSLLSGGINEAILRQAGVIVISLPDAFSVPYLPAKFGKLLRLFANFFYLWFCLIRLQPRIVHFFLPEAYVVGGFCALLSACPVLMMSRRSMNDYQRNHAWARRLEQWLHRRMSVILGNSRAVLTQLMEEGVPQSRLDLIYNGIEMAGRECGQAAKNTAREQLALADSVTVMAMVANLIPYKGHADLLQALTMSEFCRAGKPWVLLLAGRDEGVWNDLKSFAEGAGLASNVRWLGELESVQDVFLAADIGILCSHQEGFSNSLLEGMAAGLPMLVSDVGGNPEAVIDAENGLVVPAKAPAALALALDRLALDPQLRAEMGRASRLRVESYFSLDSCVAQYDQLYRPYFEPHSATGDAR